MLVLFSIIIVPFNLVILTHRVSQFIYVCVIIVSLIFLSKGTSQLVINQSHYIPIFIFYTPIFIF